MKVTAIIPDELIASARKFTGEKTTTESLIKVLKEWISIQEISRLTKELARNQLRFKQERIASKVRQANRIRS